MKLAEILGSDGTPAVFVNGERVNGGACRQTSFGLAIDRALRAAGEQPPACRRRQRRHRQQRPATKGPQFPRRKRDGWRVQITLTGTIREAGFGIYP